MYIILYIVLGVIFLSGLAALIGLVELIKEIKKWL